MDAVSPQPGRSPANHPSSEPKPARGSVAVYTAMALVVLSASSVQMALPPLAEDLGVTPAAALQVATVYQVALLLGLLPSASLGDRWGRRRAFAASLGLFGVGALAGAFAPDLATLRVARGLQGLAGAGVMALGVALLRQSVPPGGLARALAGHALTVALSAAAGPALASAALELGTWRWLVGLQVPWAGLALWLSRTLPASPPAVARGSVLPVDLLRQRPFRLAALASIACFAAQSVALLALPFHWRSEGGAGGAWLSVWPLAIAAMAPASAHLLQRLDTARLCAGGAALLALGLAGLTLAPPKVGPLQILSLVLCGAGFGLFQTPNNHHLLLATPEARLAAAGALQGLARLSGQALGAWVLAGWMRELPSIQATTAGLATGSACAVLAAALSLRRSP